MNSILYDILILLVLVAFALWGMRRGFIMTLCSLIALLVALVGSLLLTNLFAPVVAGWLEPAIKPSVTAAVENTLPEEVTQAGLSISELQTLLEKAELPFGLEDYIEQFIGELPSLNTQTLVEDVANSLTRQVATVVARTLLFLVCFIVILILWHLLARGLNLVAKLPGLHFLNKLGGLVLGVFRGAILVFVCLWLLHSSGLLAQQTVDSSHLMSFFLTLSPL